MFFLHPSDSPNTPPADYLEKANDLIFLSLPPSYHFYPWYVWLVPAHLL